MREGTFPELAAEVAARAEQPISAHDIVADAVRRKLARHLVHIVSFQEATWQGEDTEAAHQMRVGIRRARSVLGASRSVLKPKLVEAFDRRLRWLARRIARVRERDLLLEDFRRFSETVDEEQRPAFKQMIERVTCSRDQQQIRLKRVLTGRKYRQLITDLTQFVLSPPTEGLLKQKTPPLAVRHFASWTVLAHYAAVFSYEGLLPEATGEQLHKLRIACKRLRYVIEFFDAPLAALMQALTKPIKAMQRQLGLVHDLDVVIAFVKHLSRKLGMTPALTQYLEQRSAERESALRGVPRTWSRLTSEKYRKSLGQAVLSL